MSCSESTNTIERLKELMRLLRDPNKGCPWDKMQTFATIAPYTLEETYEVLDAIERQDYDDLREELGDLLFQVVFYAEIAREQNLFSFDDVCQAINDKLVRRHPHVFGERALDSITDINARWEKQKGQERADKARFSVLDDIPQTLPALMRAYKIQKRCATVGFDWHSLGPVIDKVHEEIDEVKFEATQVVVNEQKLEEELGDLLFATVNLSRHLGHKAEKALQTANRKFERRFRRVELLAEHSGKSLGEMTLDEMEALWQKVKEEEKTALSEDIGA
jgi:ATP diphosphatase